MGKKKKSISPMITQTPERILQFGGGNFLRAFTDWMFHVLNKETDFNGSVVVVKPTKRGDYTELKEQKGKFHVALDGIKEGALVSELVLVESVSRAIQSYTEWDEYLNIAENPDMRFVVSNTTEAGIQFSSSDQLNDTPPHEFPAKLTVWLYHRFQHFEANASKGCIILPCELIEKNGDTLRSVVLQYAKYWELGIKFINWIDKHNYFCNTLVDRIVSGYPTERAKTILKQTSFDDQLLVAGEQYHNWVIQGPTIVQKELQFSKTNLNVQFVDDITEYREMKVRILNGAHTSMVPVGYLSGIRTVKEVMDDPEISTFIGELLSEEITITLTNIPSEELSSFVNETLDRFRNPTLRHFLINIALNSTSKFIARLLPTLKDYISVHKQLPKRIVFAFSCLIRMYEGSYNEEAIVLNDKATILEFFKSNWERKNDGSISIDTMVSNLLKNTEIWGENLDVINGFSKAVSENLQLIDQLGVKDSIKQIMDHKSLV